MGGRLEAIWGEADYNMEDLSALYAACEKVPSISPQTFSRVH